MPVFHVRIPGVSKDQVVEITSPVFKVGRNEDCHFILREGQVSRLHFTARVDGAKTYVKDCQSRNGTFINGNRLIGEHRVLDGDVIQICGVRFEYRDECAPGDISDDEFLQRPAGDPNVNAHGDEATMLKKKGLKDQDLPPAFWEISPEKIVAEFGRLAAYINGVVLLRWMPTQNSFLSLARYPEGNARYYRSYAKQCLEELKVLCFNYETDSDHVSGTDGNFFEHGSGMYCPLILDGAWLGVVALFSESAHIFDLNPPDRAVLESLQRTCAQLLRNINLWEQLKAAEAYKRDLHRLFSPRLARYVESCNERFKPGGVRGGTRRRVSVFCSDICKFTEKTQGTHADDVIDSINDYLAVVVPIIHQNDGIIDKYQGDGVLAVFGVPEEDDEHEYKAVRAAWEIKQALLDHNRELLDLDKCTLETKIGIHCGEVAYGFVGTTERLELTVIGSVVNFASRLCDSAGPDEIVISDDIWNRDNVQRVTHVIKKDVKRKHPSETPPNAYQVTAWSG